MGETEHTPGPFECATGSHGKNRVHKWAVRKHEFPQPPYEGDLNDEWGIYPPLGESGPVALVAGEANARLFAAAPDLLEVAKLCIGSLPSDTDDLTREVFRRIRDAIAKAECSNA